MTDKIKSEPDGPVDRYKMVYIIFYWLGIGTLLPWNMFISVSGLSECHTASEEFPINRLRPKCSCYACYAVQ